MVLDIHTITWYEWGKILYMGQQVFTLSEMSFEEALLSKLGCFLPLWVEAKLVERDGEVVT